jgi:hypothetical protein
MNPDELESLVNAQKQQEAEAARLRHEKKKQTKKKKSKGSERYVTLEEKDGTSHLTLSGTGPRVFTAFYLIFAGVLLVLPAIAWVWLLIPAGVLIVWGVLCIIFPRTTYRVMLTNGSFALFAGGSAKPLHYGPRERLSMRMDTFKKGDKVLHISVRLDGDRYWSESLMEMDHPEDVALLESFIRKLKPQD